jgi:cytoskeletal protein CcmA (bactofilin family)
MGLKKSREGGPGADCPEVPPTRPARGREPATLGGSIRICGDVTGEEDLLIEGMVEGRVELQDGELIVGRRGDVTADISARAVNVRGQLTGNVAVTDRVEVQSSGQLRGDIVCPTLIVHEGAEINGSITTKRPTALIPPDTEKKA